MLVNTVVTGRKSARIHIWIILALKVLNYSCKANIKTIKKQNINISKVYIILLNFLSDLCPTFVRPLSDLLQIFIKKIIDKRTVNSKFLKFKH